MDASFEVLEFLGDAVLDLAISDLLIRRFPERTEGDLSRMRAGLVNSVVLAEKANLLSLGPLLLLGKGEERSAGRHKASILAGAFEAILGGVYQDGGYDAARILVERRAAAPLATSDDLVSAIEAASDMRREFDPGGIGATTFSTTSTLPAGLTLAANGVLSGTPTQTGTFPIDVTVTDGNGCTGTNATPICWRELSPGPLPRRSHGPRRALPPSLERILAGPR